MKKGLLLFAFVMSCMQLFAQKFEFSLLANTGLFHYSGDYAVATTVINEDQVPGKNYTNNPYGRGNGFSYGGAVQGQYVSKKGLIAGLQAGYDVLRSKVLISNVYPPIEYFYDPGSYINYNNDFAAKGQTYLQDQSININPYIGYRLRFKKVSVDMLPGAEFGINVRSYDKGSAKSADGTVYSTNNKLPDAPLDVRLKFGIAAYYKRFALTAAYSHGLTNYTKSVYIPDVPNSSEKIAQTHSELLRLGLSYRIF